MTEADNLILIDKPAGWTSFDVCARIRAITGEQHVGHAGALDPMATGLLVVALGDATKTLGDRLEGAKAYRAEVTLGALSGTWDSDAPWTLTVQAPRFEASIIREALQAIQRQDALVPPMIASIKRKGVRLYKLAHQGWWLERDPRPVQIDALTLEACDSDAGVVTFTVAGGGGLYVRAIAHDLGVLLGTPALLTGLRRLKVGEYRVEDAVTMEAFERSLT